MVDLDMRQNFQIRRIYYSYCVATIYLGSINTRILSSSRQIEWQQAEFTIISVVDSHDIPQTKNGLFHILKRCFTITHCSCKYIQRYIRSPGMTNIWMS